MKAIVLILLVIIVGSYLYTLPQIKDLLPPSIANNMTTQKFSEHITSSIKGAGNTLGIATTTPAVVVGGKTTTDSLSSVKNEIGLQARALVKSANSYFYGAFGISIVKVINVFGNTFAAILDGMAKGTHEGTIYLTK